MSADFFGLFGGAAIRVEGTVHQYGAVACLLARQGETAPAYLLTAGHLFAAGEIAAEVVAATEPDAPPVVVGALAHNLLDPPFDLGFAIDVAVVALSADGVALAVESDAQNPGPRLIDFIPAGEAGGKRVRAFLPSTGGYSRRALTLDAPGEATLAAELRGVYRLSDVIFTDRALGDTYGDSGTMLCAGARDRFAVGICIGRYDDTSVCEPAGRAIAAVGGRLGETLNIWSAA